MTKKEQKSNKKFKEIQKEMTPEKRLFMRKQHGWDDRDVEDLFNNDIAEDFTEFRKVLDMLMKCVWKRNKQYEDEKK